MGTIATMSLSALVSPFFLSSSLLARQARFVPAYAHSFFGPGSLSALHSLRSANRHPLFYESAARLLDNEKNYHLIARLPGVSASSVDVKLSSGFLDLAAREADGNDVIFQRKWPFPADADPSTLRAWMTNGVLEVKANKLEPLPPIQITAESIRPGDLATDDDAYEVSRLVPGISAEDVKIQISEERILNIHAEAKHQSYANRYSQSFLLPKRSDAPATRAWCENGILTIRVPKQAELAPIEIVVNAAASIATEPTSEFKTLAVRRVPGYSNKDVKVVVQNDQCVVELQRSGETVARERLPLPEKLVDPHAVDATCENGVLTIQYPKSALKQHEEFVVPVSGERPLDEFEPVAEEARGEGEDDDGKIRAATGL